MIIKYENRGTIYNNNIEIKAYINDSYHILNFEFYTNKFDEEIFKVEYDNDCIKLCNPKQHEFQKYIMLLLERNLL